MTSTLRRVIETFQQAQEEHGKDRHDPLKAEALRQARVKLDATAGAMLRRLPFRVRIVGAGGHMVVGEEVLLREGRRMRGQTLCGAPPGRLLRGHPAPCGSCLRTADRYLTDGPPPLELELGL